MKDFSDEQIEHLLAIGLKESTAGPTYSFASKVTKVVKAKAYRRKDNRFYLLSVLIFIGGMTAAYLMMTLINQKLGEQFLVTMLKYKLLFTLAITVILSVLYADQKFMQKELKANDILEKIKS